MKARWDAVLVRSRPCDTKNTTAAKFKKFHRTKLTGPTQRLPKDTDKTLFK
jgi:hypothetical protein